MFKATGHRNAYFPLFIPLSYMQKERNTSKFWRRSAPSSPIIGWNERRRKNGPRQPVDRALVVRPTSETIIGASYAKWVAILPRPPDPDHQWANVVRWEMRPACSCGRRNFSGRKAYRARNRSRARAETRADARGFTRPSSAIICGRAVYTGEKSESTFPRAVQTLCIEAGAGSQELSSPALPISRPKFFALERIQFRRATKTGVRLDDQLGVSTRMVAPSSCARGHDGLVLPPRIAPTTHSHYTCHAKARNARSGSGCSERPRSALRVITWHEFADRGARGSARPRRRGKELGVDQ